MKLKKILASILAICMVLSTMSFTAMAKENAITTFDELKNAISSATAGDTITLSADIAKTAYERDYDFEPDVALTFDLGGNTLYLNGDNLFSSDVTFTNGTIVVGPKTSTAFIWMYSGADLVLNDITLKADGATGYSVISGTANGTITIENSSIEITDTDNSITDKSEATIIADAPDVNIEKTSITATNVARGFVTCNVEIDSDSSVTMSNNSKTAFRNVSGVVDGNVTITACDYGIENSDSQALTFDKNAVVSISDCVESDVSVGANASLKIETGATVEYGTSDISGTITKTVATVNGVSYTDLQEAIKAAAPSGTVEIVDDIVVDKWIMFAETMSIGNGNLITLNINGLTINGNNNTLTIKNVESAKNGSYLFYDAQNLNIKDLTIEYVDAAANLGGIGLQSGTLENVNFVGGGYGVLPGDGEITITGCNFKTNNTAIYYEAARDDLVVDNCTFDQGDKNVILLRGATEFTNNTVISGRTVNVVSGSPVVIGNNFNNVRLKVYNEATATIENNEINVLAFNDESEVNSTFGENTLSKEAEETLKEVGVIKEVVAKIGNEEYYSLQEALADVGAGDVVIDLVADAELDVSNAYIKLGTENTTSLIINGNDNRLDLTTTYWSRLNMANEDATLILNDMTVDSSQASGTWNSYDITFLCPVELNNVDFEKAVAIENDAKLNTVSITETHDYYALWISALGQTVEIDGLIINSDGRGIKIDDEYTNENCAKVTFDIKNADINTQKKAAIMVKTFEGADITAQNVDISDVKADSINLVWIDEDATQYKDLVNVQGATTHIEGLVATISTDTYSSLQKALDAATSAPGTYQINLASIEIDEDVIVHQTENVNITIKGNNTVFTGHIEVYGHARYDGEETLTIDGIDFETSQASHIFIEQNTTDSVKRYPHNVTVQNCTFTATDAAVNTAVALKLRQGNNNTIKNTVSTNMHSLLQNDGGEKIQIDTVEITGKGGISLGSVTGVKINNATMNVSDYGIRIDADVESETVIEDCDIEAFIPVVVRTAQAQNSLVFNGTNTMTQTNSDGIWCAIGTSEYETNGSLPTKATADVTVKLNDEGLDVDGIYGQKLFLNGEGTQEKPFLINNLTDLKTFRNIVDTQASDGSGQFTDKYVKLTANIDLDGENWNPIGSMSGDKGSFKGIFDGDGYTISNLYIEASGTGLGFFARTTGNAVIKNLTFENVKIKSTDNSHYAGTVVANSYASTKIENVHVKGNIDISGRGYIGGISGHGYVKMDNVSVIGEGTISSSYWCAGGILGYGAEGATDIKNAKVEGTGNGLVVRSAAGGLGSIVGMAEDNHGTQPISGSNLSAKNVKLQTYAGAYSVETYGEYALGYLYGGNDTSILTGYLIIENVTFDCSTGNTNPEVSDAVATVGNVIYFDLSSALNAVNDNETITILRDVTFTKNSVGYTDGTYTDGVRYNGDKNFTVDFNGYTLTDDGCVNDYLIYINNKGDKENEITFIGGTIVSKNGCWSAVCVGASNSLKKTALNLNEMNIENRNGAEYSGNLAVRVRGSESVENIVNVNNGTVITSDGASFGIAASTDGSIVNINNGAKVVQKNSGTTGGNNVYTAVGGKGVINIYDGAAIESDAYGVHTMTTGTPLVYIYGGTITADIEALRASTNGGVGELSTIYVYGGTIYGALNETNSDSHILVSGGNFSQDPTDYLVDGCVAELNSQTGLYSINDMRIAQIGDTKYATLQKAFDAAQNGDTITLLDDFSIEGTVDGVITVSGKDVTLDLNGKTITATDNATGNFSLFYIGGKDDGTLTVKDSGRNGKIQLTSTNNREWNALSAIFHNRGGILNVQSGTYTHNGGTDMAFAVDNSANSYGDATTNVSGGKLNSSYIAIRNRMDTYGANGGGNGTAIINVTDGEIYGYKRGIWGQVSSAGVKGVINISDGKVTSEQQDAIVIDEDATGEFTNNITGGKFSSDVSDFCADGYVAISSGNSDLWRVCKERQLKLVPSVKEDEEGELVVKTNETFTIDVVTSGIDADGVRWTLDYDENMFELTGVTTYNYNVVNISGDKLTVEIADTIANGSTVATYTFKSLNEAVENSKFEFTIKELKASGEAWMEVDASSVTTAVNTDITIELREFVYTVTVDDKTITTETGKEFNYDGADHTLVVNVTDPTDAKITYKVNGQEKDSVVVRGENVWNVEYTITKDGYEKIEGTYTFTIKEPVYKVEVDVTETADYVSGYKLVLVYTDAENVTFDYAGIQMLDASGAKDKYLYNGTDDYEHVFALVVESLDGMESLTEEQRKAAYEALVTVDYEDKAEPIDYDLDCDPECDPECVHRDCDINFSNSVNFNDIVAAYSVLEKDEEAFEDYMAGVIKADVNFSKTANNEDVTIIIGAVYPSETNN